MSSLRKYGSVYRLQFRDLAGASRTITCGTDRAAAQSVQRVVDSLVAHHHVGGRVPSGLASDLRDIGAGIRERLVECGLWLTSAELSGISLVSAIDRYLESHADVHRASTKKSWQQTRSRALLFFGESRAADSLTAGDAMEFRSFLSGKCGLSENTVRKTCSNVSVVLNFLVDHEAVSGNVFKKLPRSVRPTLSRHFVTREILDKVLRECVSDEHRLLFLLSRVGGLRVPSEAFALKWTDIDWEASRIRVSCVKTARSTGKSHREVPLFPELREELWRVHESAPDGSVWVIQNLRSKSGNVGQPLKKVVERAGLAAWPRLFHNMRMSRQTELAAAFPLFVVCEWLGNTMPVAAKHYLQVLPEHFSEAIQGSKPHDNPTTSTTGRSAP